MKLALVTGGHRRLGAAICGILARAGYAVAIHGSHDALPEPGLDALLSATDWHGFIADFTEPASAISLISEVTAHFGRAPDLLVNSAALFGQDRLETVDAGALMSHYAVNAAAPALLTQAFAASGAGEGARSIVNILDQRLDHPHGDQLSYTLSKYALAGLTRIAARELAPHIRVNAVAPGLTLRTDEYSESHMATLGAAMPLGATPSPDDIGEAILYLAGARSVTGQTIYVDGGARMVSYPRDFMHL